MLLIDNINFPTAQQIYLSTNWSGRNLLTELAWLPNDTEFFVLPFIFANFLNEYSIKKEHVLRFWFGWQFLTPDLSLKRSELLKKMRDLQIKLLIIINDKLNDKNCIIERNLSNDKWILLNNFGKYLADFQYTDQPNSIYHLNLLWKNAFLIPTKCLNTAANKLNNLKISWTSAKSKPQFPQATSRIKINFRWPITTPLIRYELKTKEAIRFKMPFFYWMRFRLSKPALIEPIIYQAITLFSDLKSNYQFQNPFEGLFHFNLSPFNWNDQFKKILSTTSTNLRQFFHDLIVNFRFNFEINQPHATTQIFYKHRLNEQFTSFFKYQFKIRKHLKFLMNDQSFIYSFEHFLQSNSTKKLSFPIILNQNKQQAFFLTNHITPNLILNLKTTLQIPIFNQLQILFFQTVEFENQWINEIKIKSKPIIFKNRITNRYLLTFLNLEKILESKVWKELKIENTRI